MAFRQKDKVRRFFLICFGLLQNATTVDQFKIYFEKIIIIFSSQFVNAEYSDALAILSKEIETRNMIRKIEIDNNLNIDTVEFQKDQKHLFPVDEKIYTNLKNNSPFKLHFLPIIAAITETIRTRNNIEQKKNIFYAPIFLEIIYDYLHLLPLWTGLMINEWNNKYSKKFNFPSRLSNNAVENHFKVTKFSVLNKTKKVMPSIMTSLFYARIQSKYVQYYANRDKIIIENQKPLMFFENWKDKNIKQKIKKTDRISYYSDYHDIIVDAMSKQENKIENNINNYLGSNYFVS